MLKTTKATQISKRRKAPQKEMPSATSVRYSLPALEFDKRVKERSEDILGLLNRPYVNPPPVNDSLYAPAGFTAAPLALYGGASLYGTAARQHPAHPPAKKKSLYEILRGLVDEWLNSGLHSSESETPKDRNFEKSPEVKRALFAYSAGGHLLLLPEGNTASLWLDQDHLPWAKPDNNPQHYYVEPLKHTLKHIAEAEMAFILLSDLRFRLAKCRKCGIYFLLKHWNRTYSRGTMCNSCQRLSRTENSVETTATVRANAADALHKMAAKRFHKKIGVKGWQQDKAFKTAIAEYLNAQIQRSDTLRPIYYNDQRKGLTGKWTAQAKNWRGIEKALKAIETSAAKPESAKRAKR